MNKTSAGKSNIAALCYLGLFIAFSKGQKKVGHILKYKAHISKYVPCIFSFLRGRV